MAKRILELAELKDETAALEAASKARKETYGPVWDFVMRRARFAHFNNGTVCHVAAASNLWLLFQFFSGTGANPFELDASGRLPSESAANAGHVCLAVHIRCIYEAPCFTSEQLRPCVQI